MILLMKHFLQHLIYPAVSCLKIQSEFLELINLMSPSTDEVLLIIIMVDFFLS